MNISTKVRSRLYRYSLWRRCRVAHGSAPHHPLEAFGRVCAVATPITSVLISLANALYDRDFRAEGRHLGVLGWDGLTAEQILGQVG
jgi:hypothetical protein